VFSSFIKQHSEASGRIAGLAEHTGDSGEDMDQEVDEFEALRRNASRDTMESD
jgi:hypothetical protein